MGSLCPRRKASSIKYISGGNAEVHGWNYRVINVQDKGAFVFIEEGT